MNRIEFDSLKIQEQIDYINTEIQKGISLNSICNEIGIKSNTMSTRIKTAGFIKDSELNQYVLQEGLTEPKEAGRKSVATTPKEKRNTTPHKSPQEASGMIELIKRIETLENQFKSIVGHSEVIQEGFKDESGFIVKKFKGESKQITNRINVDVYEKLERFYQEHDLYNRQDVLNSLLDEALNKYLGK